MVLKAVILKEEIQGIEDKWLKFRIEGEKFSISEVGWELQGKKQLEKVLDAGEMSAFLRWKHVHPLVSLRVCTHLRSWEPETQRDGVGMYSRGEGSC